MDILLVQQNNPRVGLCDQDLLKTLSLLEEAYKSDNACKTSLMPSKSYRELLVSEHKARFNLPYSFDFKAKWRVLPMKVESPESLNIVKLSVEEYQGITAGFAEWVMPESIPDGWARRTHFGRLFCRLPEKLTDQSPIPMEAGKEDKPETSAAIQKRLALMAKSVGTKPLVQLEVETALINGDTPESITIELMKKKNDYSKGVKFLLEKKHQVKHPVRDVRRWIKEGSLKENLEGYTDVIDEVDALFVKYGLE